MLCFQGSDMHKERYVVDSYENCVSHGYVGYDDGCVPIYQNSETPLYADDAPVNHFIVSNESFSPGAEITGNLALGDCGIIDGGIVMRESVNGMNAYQQQFDHQGVLHNKEDLQNTEMYQSYIMPNYDETYINPSYHAPPVPNHVPTEPYGDVYQMFVGVESPSGDVSTYSEVFSSNLSTPASQPSVEDYGLRSFDEQVFRFSPNEISDQSSSDYERTTEDEQEMKNVIDSNMEYNNFESMTSQCEVMNQNENITNQYMEQINGMMTNHHEMYIGKKRKFNDFDQSYLHTTSLKSAECSENLSKRVNMIPIQNDGFKWRKYGQKTVKGSEFPRNYFKCSTSNCPAKKHVERYVDSQGHLREKIKYIGEHTHLAPNSSKVYIETQDELREVIQVNMDVSEDDSTDTDPVSTKLVVECHGYIDHSDDGFSWRKYGQKNVKGLYKPRQYFRCTAKDCNVKKQVESITQTKTVITYDGKHNHESNFIRESIIYVSNEKSKKRKRLCE